MLPPSTAASRRTARGAREPSPLVEAWRRHCRRLCRATSAKTLNSALFFHTAWVTFSTAELCRRRHRRRRHCRGTKSNYMLLNVDPLQKKLAMSGQSLIFLSVKAKHNHLHVKSVKCTQFLLFGGVFAIFFRTLQSLQN